MSNIRARRPERAPRRRVVSRYAAAGLLALAGLLAIAVLHYAPKASPASEIASRLVGERWYAMTLRHRPVGHYRANTIRTGEGHFEFQTELRFRLAGSDETRMADTLLFDGHPPHPLLRAEHAAYAGDALLTHVVIGAGVATVSQGAEQRQLDMATDLRLGEYLAIERWLAEDGPGVGETHAARAVDFDRLAIVTDDWRVLAKDAEGVDVGKDGQNGSTFVRLDRAWIPQRMRIGPLFTLQAVAYEGVARLWERRPSVFDDAQHVPVDQRIPRPGALTRLVLAIEHTGVDAPPWLAAMPSMLSADRRSRPPADANDAARASVATVRYPADDSRLADLAERAVAGLTDEGEQAKALLGFVHGHLRYRDTDHAGGVLDTMRSRTGDCTEFADFYTTLARAIGLPARTVVGLAYREDPHDVGAFALHAWNEVVVNGAWHHLDPTWGQAAADLTHLALPEESALTFIAARPNLRLQVLEAIY